MSRIWTHLRPDASKQLELFYPFGDVESAMVISERVQVSLKNVLLAVDFSETSLLALPYAAGIAQHFRGKVFLAHVNEQSKTSQVAPEMRSTMDKMILAAEEGAIASVPGLLKTPHEAVFDNGGFCPTLLSVAKNCNIDLIVIGTHGTRGIRKLLQGSKAQEIVSLSTKPVLAIGPRISTAPEFRRILYTTDFSPASVVALPVADSLRGAYNSSLIVLHVNDGETEETAADASPRTDLFMQNARAAGYGDMVRHCEVVVEFGSRSERIVEVAERSHADLIVLGLQTPKGLSARLAAHMPGSMAFGVISRAPCPVLTVSCSNPITHD